MSAAARIARLAKEAGAKHFVHMSALGTSETSASSYARSKAAGEQAVRMFFPDAAIIRPSIVFGPEDNFFKLFATLARYSPALPLIGGGMTKFQPVYVGDVAEAILRSLNEQDAQGVSYELGGPQIYSFRELIEMILHLTGRKRFLFDVSWPLAKIHAALHEILPLPRPLITRDQVELLKTDTIVRAGQTNGLRALGIAPTALEIILPTYLDRFRKTLESKQEGNAVRPRRILMPATRKATLVRSRRTPISRSRPSPPPRSLRCTRCCF